MHGGNSEEWLTLGTRDSQPHLAVTFFGLPTSFDFGQRSLELGGEASKPLTYYCYMKKIRYKDVQVVKSKRATPAKGGCDDKQTVVLVTGGWG